MTNDMKAMVIHKYGNHPVSLQQVPIPHMNANEVRVKIKAASVNPIDFKIRNGELKILLSYTFPLTLGNDFAGVITEVGSHVKDFKVGDKVYGRPNKAKIGTFAEYISIDEQDIAIMPNNLTFEEAASIPLVGLTSYQAFNDLMHLKKGDKVLIQAGAGGVGTFAIQLAKAMGLYVTTTASEQGHTLVQSLGADQIINYKKEDFSQVLTNFDGVLDTLGGKYLHKSFTILKANGTVVSVSGIPTTKVANELQLNPLKKFALQIASSRLIQLAKKNHVNYEFLFMKPSGQQLKIISKLIEDGQIQPVIDQVFHFEQTQDALEYSSSGRAKGKIIIKMN